MDNETTLTLSTRELVDTYRAIRATMTQLEPYAEDPGVRAYIQRLDDLHARLVGATIAAAGR